MKNTNYFKFLVNKTIGFVLFFFLISCSPPTTTDPTVDPATFFSITYIATESEGINLTTPWTPVQGQFLMKFTQSTDPAANGSGTFIMHYTSYLEPQLCPFNQNCVCSGGTDGVFTVYDPNASPTPTSSAVPYSPTTTYTPTTNGSSSTIVDPNDPTIAIIYTYNFNISISESNLTSGCKPEANRLLQIVRFANGDLIMTNGYRYQLLTPVVIGN